MTQSTSKGFRIRLSPAGLMAVPRFRDKAGTIVGEGKTGGCWHIRFEGYKTLITLHKVFVEIVGRPARADLPVWAKEPDPVQTPPIDVDRIRALRHKGWSKDGIVRYLRLPEVEVAKVLGLQTEGRL